MLPPPLSLFLSLCRLWACDCWLEQAYVMKLALQTLDFIDSDQFFYLITSIQFSYSSGWTRSGTTVLFPKTKKHLQTVYS